MPVIKNIDHRPALAWAAAGHASSSRLDWLGAQSYSFRNFDLQGALACLEKLGLKSMEFCAVHFAPDVEAEGFAQVQETLAQAGVQVPCFGVEGFDGDAEGNRRKFVFAQALKVEILTADPTPEAFDNLDALCEEFQIKIAIHNHGPGARYDAVADTLSAVEGRHPYIGACVDTGHVLRSGEAPHEVIEALGARVHALHLKDWTIGGEEQILGAGDLDLSKTAQALQKIGFNGPIMMEYELSPENPVADMQQGFAAWRAAVAAL